MSLPVTETDSVRLSLRLSPGQLVIEGAWWPRSLRLEDELPPLVVVPPDAGAAESAAAMSAFDLGGTRSTSTEGTQPPPYHAPDLPSVLAQQLLSTKETVRQAMLRVRGIADAGTRARAAAVLEVDLTLAATEARTVVDQAEPATDARA
ncbi:DUF5994 family protein [Phycicoccus jejuensis]|uniref:hypothetical protein n=1 Tax=Phycicoccus jejuensis TaxID=367299 RepID=UPI003850CDFC